MLFVCVCLLLAELLTGRAVPVAELTGQAQSVAENASMFFVPAQLLADTQSIARVCIGSVPGNTDQCTSGTVGFSLANSWWDFVNFIQMPRNLSTPSDLLLHVTNAGGVEKALLQLQARYGGYRLLLPKEHWGMQYALNTPQPCIGGGDQCNCYTNFVAARLDVPVRPAPDLQVTVPAPFPVNVTLIKKPQSPTLLSATLVYIRRLADSVDPKSILSHLPLPPLSTLSMDDVSSQFVEDLTDWRFASQSPFALYTHITCAKLGFRLSKFTSFQQVLPLHLASGTTFVLLRPNVTVANFTLQHRIRIILSVSKRPTDAGVTFLAWNASLTSLATNSSTTSYQNISWNTKKTYMDMPLPNDVVCLHSTVPIIIQQFATLVNNDAASGGPSAPVATTSSIPALLSNDVKDSQLDVFLTKLASVEAVRPLNRPLVKFSFTPSSGRSLTALLLYENASDCTIQPQLFIGNQSQAVDCDWQVGGFSCALCAVGITKRLAWKRANSTVTIHFGGRRFVLYDMRNWEDDATTVTSVSYMDAALSGAGGAQSFGWKCDICDRVNTVPAASAQSGQVVSADSSDNGDEGFFAADTISLQHYTTKGEMLSAIIATVGVSLLMVALCLLSFVLREIICSRKDRTRAAQVAPLSRSSRSRLPVG